MIKKIQKFFEDRRKPLREVVASSTAIKYKRVLQAGMFRGEPDRIAVAEVVGADRLLYLDQRYFSDTKTLCYVAGTPLQYQIEDMVAGRIPVLEALLSGDVLVLNQRHENVFDVVRFAALGDWVELPGKSVFLDQSRDRPPV